MREFKLFGHKVLVRGGDVTCVIETMDEPTIIMDIEPVEKVVYGMTGCAGLFDGKPATFSWTDYYPPLKKKKPHFGIKKIQLNPKKNATTVLWEDGTYTVVKKSPGDDPADIWSVVSYALAEKVYGSNSAFKREIKGKVQNLNERK